MNQHPFLQLPDSEAQTNSSGIAKGIAEGIALPSVSKETPVLDFLGKRIKWLILPLHESETDRHLIGLSG